MAIFGVDCWGRGGELLPDWRHIALEGRVVYVVYDSDVVVKPEVQDALRRFVAALEGRGAVVRVIYLPDAPDGSKQGVDDYLSGAGTVAELEGMARPFEADDLLGKRLNQDARLEIALEIAAESYEAMPARTVGECTRRAAMRAAVRAAAERGELVEGGVYVPRLDRRTWAETAGTTRQSINRAVPRLEADGHIRVVPPRESGEAGGVMLRASSHPGTAPRALPCHIEGSSVAGGGEATADRRESSHPGTVARALDRTVPELRSPFVLCGYERRDDGRRHPVYQYVARLGKPRAEIIRYLVERGGEAAELELMERFAGERTRLRDFRRRRLADLAGYIRAYKGAPLSVGPAIIEIALDLVRLVSGWRKAVEVRREMGGEQAAARRQKVAHLIQRRAFRERNRRSDPAPTRSDMDRRCERRLEGRRAYLERAVAALMRDRPEYRRRRVGQITCAVITGYIGPDFPRGVDPGGPPTDAEVAVILEDNGMEVAA